MSGPLSTFTARVQWLADHPEVIQNWPSHENLIKSALQQAGLISSKTDTKYMDVGKLITAARKKLHDQRHVQKQR